MSTHQGSQFRHKQKGYLPPTFKICAQKNKDGACENSRDPAWKDENGSDRDKRAMFFTRIKAYNLEQKSPAIKKDSNYGQKMGGGFIRIGSYESHPFREDVMWTTNY